MDSRTAASLAQIRAATAANRAVTAELAAERAKLAADATQAEQRRASAARRGELGDDWRTLQTRIDARRTTLSAIMSGEDESPEARRVTEHAFERLRSMRDEFDQAIRTSDPEDPGSPAATVRATSEAAAEIRRTLARLRDAQRG
ncbi:hypothetical protein [Cellulomonas sp. NPDC089187]|uniref:hypothetical protein n=1 Tax=Cellulomonas sp. NPDC089187 TaxID=3154970 RepID=UPI003417141F